MRHILTKYCNWLYLSYFKFPCQYFCSQETSIRRPVSINQNLDNITTRYCKDITTTIHLVEDKMDSVNIPEVDALLVGAGFASFAVVNRLRKQGLSCKIYEKGSSSGGIWFW